MGAPPCPPPPKLWETLIRAGQWSITTSLWPLITHIYHVIIIVTSSFSKKYFFIIICRSSCMQLFFKRGATRNFAIFTGKFNLAQKETLQVIPVKIAKFLRTAFLWNTSSGYICQFDPLFLIKNKIYGKVSTKDVCRSGQSMLFRH